MALGLVRFNRVENVEKVDSQNPINLPILEDWASPNGGYCGECSFKASGQYFGQYLSQYDIRAIAAKMNQHQNPQTNCQLLLGDNDQYTAAALHLQAQEWPNSTDTSSKDYLVWVKQQTAKGFPVVMGVYMNQWDFYGKKNPNAGDSEYDHIVYVFSVASKYKDNLYHEDDIITYCDLGLYNPSGPAPYIFSSTFKDFQKNRQQANSPV